MYNYLTAVTAEEESKVFTGMVTDSTADSFS